MAMTILAIVVLVFSLALAGWSYWSGQAHNALFFAGLVCIAVSSLVDPYTSVGAAVTLIIGSVLFIASIAKRPLHHSG